MRGSAVAAVTAVVAMGVITAAHDSLPSTTSASAPLPPGSYEIGVDISAGKWHTDGPRARTVHGNGEVALGEDRCSWWIGWHKLRGGQPQAWIIAHGDDVSGPVDVVVGPEGATFETKGCKAWRRQ